MNGDGKKYLKICLIVLFAAIILAAAFYFIWTAYQHFSERRSLAHAQEFLQHGDFPNALLSARHVLLINSNNVAACRIMADLADAAHSPATLDWRRRVAQLPPTIDDKLALAAAGLRYQNPPFPLTTQILNELAPSADKLPNFHALVAQLALGMRDLPDAQRQLKIACQLEPTNKVYQLNLAVVSLGSTNVEIADDARAKLKSFSSDLDLGATALRSLITDSVVRNQFANALNFSSQLLASTNAALNDRLQNLTLLKNLEKPALTNQLRALQSNAATNALMAAQVASWMDANDFRADAIQWLTNLSATVQTQSPVRVELVNCFLTSSNWPALRDFTAKSSWGDIEFLRLAFLSHACDKLDDSMVAHSDWRSAVDMAQNQPAALNTLLDLARRWGMVSQQKDLLWRILRKSPDTGWAQRDLEQLYFNDGDTRGLYQLYFERFKIFPNNAELENNLACTALLLKTNLNAAYEWAAAAYAQKSNSPVVVSTYAYALHLQGRDNDALESLQKLDSRQLQEPSVALYYGLLLADSGKKIEAAPFLQIAETRAQLLPEEKKMLEAAEK